MYADEAQLFIFDGAGNALLNVPRSARTLTEYPVVADVEDRWIQARRIWNQHTVRTNAQIEGGSICDPQPQG